MRLPRLATLGAMAALGAFALGAPANAQNTIKIGVPMPLSGPGALYGEPSVKGARMFADEINAAGGVLGKKIELVIRDSKASADEAVRVSREMILKEEVQFLVGTFTSAEGPAVSTIAKENKIILIAPVPKTDQLTAAKNLHPYVFRTAANTTIEGRSAAEIIATWKDVKRVATIAPDYAYGQDVAKSFIDHIKKLRPDIEIVDQQWPKLGEADYTPFINAQMARKPEAVFSALWGGHLVAWIKQAKPLGFFDLVQSRVVNGGEAGSVEVARALGPDYPFGIWGNSYDLASYAGQPEAHKKYIDRLKAYTKEDPPSTWPITVYVAMQFLVEGIKKANSLDSDKVAKALLDLTIDAPFGKQTIRGKDHQADRGQFYGKMIKGPDGNAIMSEVKYVDPKPFMD
jgi:branched-chain amino acid transport system substrate-binding protein